MVTSSDSGKHLDLPKGKLPSWGMGCQEMGESVPGVLEMRDRVPVWLRPQGGAQELGESISVTASMLKL